MVVPAIREHAVRFLTWLWLGVLWCWERSYIIIFSSWLGLDYRVSIRHYRSHNYLSSVESL